MSFEDVRDRFEELAFEYDEVVLRVVPKYIEQNDAILALIPFERSRGLKALDLGSGTGVLSYLILKAFPKAEVVAFDLSDKMLEVCAANLSAYSGRFTLREGNYATDDIGEGYDVVVAGLTVHHLEHAQKQRLFERVLEALSPGGVFLMRDLVLGASPSLTDIYRAMWREYMSSEGEDPEVWFARHLEYDIPASVEDQTAWLREAGFADVGCHWRYLNFAIFGGRKPE
ncbi:MAG: class I SAM-dependent methyltransferase [bacterium]|nr:class I SAM-dependent methyltransferase [bacterium]